MIQITQIALLPDKGVEELKAQAAKRLGIRTEELASFRIIKKSIDARKKPQIFYVYTVECEAEQEALLVKRAKDPSIKLVEKQSSWQLPPLGKRSLPPPVIVGLGPAGLFAALSLARAGMPSIVLERGRDVERRSADVKHFWKSGVLSEASNVQFGEGGAGTFSDGKLTSGTHDPRLRAVLETLVEFGAPDEILYLHKPHVGTDLLRQLVKNIRLELIRLGCQVFFEHQLQDLLVENNQIRAALVADESGRMKTISCANLILAPGHSARDTFAMLETHGISMEQKAFAIGLRIEHRQSEINRAQYGACSHSLPAADYKLACHLPTGRSVFSFCVCPGGEVVAAASEQGRLVTNGMSRYARDLENINGALLVGVGPKDFPGEDPLAGLRFQESWEAAAFALGGHNFHAPAQLVGDFLQDRASRGGGEVLPSYRPGVVWADLRRCLPSYVTESIKAALPVFERRIRGFANPDAVLTGVETRSSSPLRILRGRESLQASLRGLYPCGEGAGYAGGIVSAAVDGIRVAEALIRASAQPEEM